MNNNITQFKNKGYCVVKNSISKEVSDVIAQYALFDEMQNFSSEGMRKIEKSVTPNAHAIYADPAMESMLLHLLPVVEKNTGLKLYPTYSCYRVYRDGDSLTNHKDRPACEISVTLCFGYDFNNRNFSWPIYIGDACVEQDVTDLAIYRGCDLYHRRDPLELNDNEIWQVQGFFHYVDVNGPYSEWKYDKRENIGQKNKNNNVQTQVSDKPYIEYTK